MINELRCTHDHTPVAFYIIKRSKISLYRKSFQEVSCIASVFLAIVFLGLFSFLASGVAEEGAGIELSGFQIRNISQKVQHPELQIDLTVANHGSKAQQYLVLIDIRIDNNTGPSTYLDFDAGTLQPSEAADKSSSWIPRESGRYELRAFAIDSFENPEIMTPVLTRILLINITDTNVTYSAASESFTIVLIPDTQNYWDSGNAEIAYNQSKWIAENEKRLNIQAVIHLGDIVDNPGSEKQWQEADKMMKILDDNTVPYIMSVGNHDIGEPFGDTAKRNYKYFQRFFPDSRIIENQTLEVKKITENGANTFAYLSVGQNEFLIFSMEYCPGLDVIEKVNQVIEQNPDKRIILATHAFLRTDGTWNSVSGGGVCTKIPGTDDYSTEKIWDLVIYPHPNVFLVVSGHSSGENKRIDNNIAGIPVQQVVIDYQYKSNGGDGMLKIVIFNPEKDRIYFETYSPWLDFSELRARSTFDFGYNME